MSLETVLNQLLYFSGNVALDKYYVILLWLVYEGGVYVLHLQIMQVCEGVPAIVPGRSRFHLHGDE